jgi:hypothetical protein
VTAADNKLSTCWDSAFICTSVTVSNEGIIHHGDDWRLKLSMRQQAADIHTKPCQSLRVTADYNFACHPPTAYERLGFYWHSHWTTRVGGGNLTVLWRDAHWTLAIDVYQMVFF